MRNKELYTELFESRNWGESQGHLIDLLPILGPRMYTVKYVNTYFMLYCGIMCTDECSTTHNINLNQWQQFWLIANADMIDMIKSKDLFPEDQEVKSPQFKKAILINYLDNMRVRLCLKFNFIQRASLKFKS